MTKQEFKNEVLTDMQHQFEHKGRILIAEHFYTSQDYGLPFHLKERAIAELVREKLVDRVQTGAFHSISLRP